MSKLKNKLSRLTFAQAKKILGPEGAKLLAEGGRIEIDIDEDVEITSEWFRVNAHGFAVEISLDPSNPRTLKVVSSTGRTDCIEVGAVLSLILEEKLALGLAKPPPERVPAESLSPAELRAEALRLRQEKAQEEPFDIQSADPDSPWTDYAITNHASGKTYKVALRGIDSPETYCSCPDFKVNHLGTCKHIIHMSTWAKKHFKTDELKKKYVRQRSCITVDYRTKPVLKLLPGRNLSLAGEGNLGSYMNRPIREHELPMLMAHVQNALVDGEEIHIFPDAEEFINTTLAKRRIQRFTDKIRANPQEHPLRTSLLKTELRPYQLDGIAFAVARGRAILADDMGLGKTIQGIGVAEVFAREAQISKVLIICPASLKSQWKNEIHKFTDRTVQLIQGSADERARQYDNESFFTICNYEQVLRDLISIEEITWDLIILDEGQRIKNWESKTSRVIKSLKSRYALVLTGTPMENRLEELYSVVSFVDNLHIGPAYKFLNEHRIVDERGKVLGYKNLDKLRKALAPILLRRTRALVLKELPERQTQIVKIPPTDEQITIDTAQKHIISTIVHKKYISEMDLLRLQKALLLARMAADSTFLVDKQKPHYSSKLVALRELLEKLLEEGRKIVLFSEWTTMLNLIEEEAVPPSTEYVRLDGSIPQKKRGQLVKRFMTQDDCRIFMTTNAGSTGLNLQKANTVINVDLPWNPAILEQRIARAHRMGQQNPVQVYLLVTADTLEEQMLQTLGAKKELFTQAVEDNADMDEVTMTSGIEELKRRMEILLGTPDDAPIDESNKAKVEAELLQKRQAADAGGKLFMAAFDFLGAVANVPNQAPATPMATEFAKQLQLCSSANEDGTLSLNVNLPNEDAVKNLANVFAGIIQAAQGKSELVAISED